MNLSKLDTLQLLNARHLRHVAVVGPLSATYMLPSPDNGIQLPTLHLFASGSELREWELLQQTNGREIRSYHCPDASLSSHGAKLNELFISEYKPVFDLVILTQRILECADVPFILLVDQLLNQGGYLALNRENLDQFPKQTCTATSLLKANRSYLEIHAGSLYRKHIQLPTRSEAKESLLIPSPVAREVELCPSRKPARIVDHEERAVCTQLVELSNVSDQSLVEVPRHVCDSCRLTESDSAELNPTVASELYRIALRIQQSGGVQGCSIDEAEKLLKYAENHLEWVSAGDQSIDASSFRRNPEQCLHLDQNTTDCSTNEDSSSRLRVIYDCKHPDHDKTTLSECRYCHDFDNGQWKPQVPLTELMPVADRYPPKISTWAVGVTTAPRKESTLDACVDSIIRAGWSQPSLFVDRGTSIAPRHAHLPVTYREQRVGAWPNYYLALVELYLSQPNADAYLIVQDDAVLYDHQNLRVWLEAALWPSPNIAAVSLYCSSAYTQAEPGWHLQDQLWVWGAQAFIFPSQSARRFLIDAAVMDHRRYGKRGTANIDGVIGRWAIKAGMEIFYPTPSLVQHIGDTSTLWPKATAQGKRRADVFAGDATSPVQHARSSKKTPQSIEPVDVKPEIKLGLVTCFFNPARFQTLRSNYERFREGLGKMASHLWTIELAFDNDPFMIEGERTIRVRGTRARHQMWQKERLLNLAAEQVPEHYDAIGYIDCDLLFENPGWYSETCQLLEGFPAVQLFSEICLLSATGAVDRRKKTCVDGRLDNKSHPGGAWAFQRDLWPIPDSHILGGGDTLFLYSMKGRFDHVKLPMMTHAWAYQWAQESIDVYLKCRARIASTAGVVRHMYHGSLKNRQYRDRWQRLLDGGFDPAVDIEIDPEVGIWRWTEFAIQHKSTMVRMVADYFTERKEDE